MPRKQLISSSKFFGLFVILGAWNVTATDDSSCIDSKPMDNFDSVAQSGHWFLIDSQNEKDKTDCQRVVYYQIQEDDTLPIINMWKDNSDNSTHMELKNAKLNETGQGVTLRGYKKTVVGADFKHWLVIIVCDESADRRIVWVLTRSKNPDVLSLIPVYIILQDYDINISDLRSVDQSACPEDWSNAEKHEIDFKYEDVKQDLEKYGVIKK